MEVINSFHQHKIALPNNDFFIGGGLRQIEYQQLNVAEVAQPNTSVYLYYTELSIDKKTKNDLKPWLFFGWKIGVRF